MKSKFVEMLEAGFASRNHIRQSTRPKEMLRVAYTVHGLHRSPRFRGQYEPSSRIATMVRPHVLRRNSVRQDSDVDFGESQINGDGGERGVPHQQVETESVIAESIKVDPDNPWTAADVRRHRLGTIISIARMLLHTMIEEINRYGLLCDYIGHPYLSDKKDSVWDQKSKDGVTLTIGVHQELFEEVLILLWRDLERRGFVVHDLSFREERIQFPGHLQSRRNIKWGIGFGWNLD